MSTLSDLRTRARQRADAVGNNFFSDSEIDGYINTGLGELHDLLVTKFEDYYVNNLSFSLEADKSTYNFSAIGLNDFYKLLGVDAVRGGDSIRVKRFSFPDRNMFQADVALYNSRGYADYEYSIRGNALEFIPTPTSADTIKIWYVPQFAKLTEDSSSVDSRIMLNWEEYAVLVAATKMRQKEETSTAALERDLDRITARIEDASRERDVGEPFGVTDETSGALPYSRWGF